MAHPATGRVHACCDRHGIDHRKYADALESVLAHPEVDRIHRLGEALKVAPSRSAAIQAEGDERLALTLATVLGLIEHSRDAGVLVGVKSSAFAEDCHQTIETLLATHSLG